MKEVLPVGFSRAVLLSMWLAFAGMPRSVFGITLDAFDGVVNVSASVASPSFSSAAMAATQAAGGYRTLSTRKTGPALPEATMSVSLVVGPYGDGGAGILAHSQEVGVTAISKVAWDGDSSASSLNYAGLGGLDLTQDGATAVQIKVLSFDYPSGHSVTINIRAYDASDANGQKFSLNTITLSQAVSNQLISFPFSSFAPQGSAGGVDFHNVGALELEIVGAQSAIDLSLGWVGTDGRCPQVPGRGERVLDDCGICGGQNQDKDECGVCFGKNQAMDSCGVCFGNDRDLDDCGVCGGNNLSKDACGVCGGNGSSCADCAGTPNGKAALDVCGICNGDGTSCLDCRGVPFGLSKLDRCGLCDGDSRSCVKCVDQDLSSTLTEMLERAQDQYENTLWFTEGLKRNNPALARKARQELKTLFNKMLALIKMLPHRALQCEVTDFCVRVQANIEAISRYVQTSEKIYQLGIRVLSAPLPGNGQCRGTAKECQERVRERARSSRSMKTLARKLHRLNIEISKKIPLALSVCS